MEIMTYIIALKKPVRTSDDNITLWPQVISNQYSNLLQNIQHYLRDNYVSIKLKEGYIEVDTNFAMDLLSFYLEDSTEELVILKKQDYPWLSD